MARAGADLVIAGRNRDTLDDAVAEAAALGARALAVPTDITDAAQRETLAARTVEAYGHVDAWVNNAGGAQESDVATMIELTEDQWDTVLGLNAKAAVFAAQTAARAMAHRGGSIINISSRSGSQPNPRTGPYGAAKAALENVTATMAVELGHRGIRVNAVAPGLVLTEQNSVGDGSMAAPDRRERQIETIPLRRLGTPDDIGPLCVYLASDESSWVTGQVIQVQGGSSLTVGHMSYLRRVARDLAGAHED
jgi:NAD(P)-dependent dehydrogenase (short-subunit alcohol dehydrogenase family)